MTKKRWNKAFDSMGKLFLDLGKLAFGSLLLGAVINRGVNPGMMFLFGFIGTIAFAFVGIILQIMSED
jgi:hypothetical protein